MIGIAKPAKTRKRLAAVRAAPVVLTGEEAEVLRCWRAMDLRRRSENMRQLLRDAELYSMVPRSAAPPPVAIRIAAVNGLLVIA